MATDHSSKNTVVVLPGFVALDPTRPDARAHNLAGQKLGPFEVLKYAGRRRHATGTNIFWICKCFCGKLTLVTTGELLAEGRQSCGCLVSGKNWKRKVTNIRHHPLYTIWSGMIRRTTNDISYILRGICDGFRELEHFEKVMGPRPSLQHSVDRKDNDGGYWCGCCDECVALGRTKNVRWATMEEQCSNRGNNRRLTYNGEALSQQRIKNQNSYGPIHVDEATQKQCAADYEAGATLPELAKKYSTERHFLARLFKQLGVVRRTQAESLKLALKHKRYKMQRSLFDND